MRRKSKELKNKYRHLFGTPQGQEVLADMLEDLCWFDELTDDPEIIARHSYAVELLKICKIFTEVNKKLLVQELFNKSNPDQGEDE
jgi:hypothetical protein